MMCWDSDGYVAFGRSEERTARKDHRCDGCGSTIKPGDRYHYWAGKYDDWFMVTKACLPCRELSRALGEHCRRREDWSTDAPIDDLSSAIYEEVRFGDFGVDEIHAKWRLRRMAVQFDHRVNAAELARLHSAGVRT